MSQLHGDTQSLLSNDRASPLVYSITVHDIDWSIEPDEQFILGTGSVAGVIEHLREFINNGIFVLESGEIPKYANDTPVQKFLNLPNQSQNTNRL